MAFGGSALAVPDKSGKVSCGCATQDVGFMALVNLRGISVTGSDVVEIGHFLAELVKKLIVS